MPGPAFLCAFVYRYECAMPASVREEEQTTANAFDSACMHTHWPRGFMMQMRLSAKLTETSIMRAHIPTTHLGSLEGALSLPWALHWYCATGGVPDEAWKPFAH